jgi:hypothetical protein
MTYTKMLIAIFIIILLYIVFSFSTLHLNPLLWVQETRVLFSFIVLMFFMGIIITIIQ